jgi:hypothetical protein
MSNPRKIKIHETSFDEKNSLVIWQIEFLDDHSMIKLVWKSQDLGPAIGITAEISPTLMKDFCEKMKGKEINLVIESDIVEHPDVKNLTTEDIVKLDQKLMEDFEVYKPLWEDGKI